LWSVIPTRENNLMEIPQWVQDDDPLRHLERSERSLEYKEILHYVQDDGKEVQDDRA